MSPFPRIIVVEFVFKLKLLIPILIKNVVKIIPFTIPPRRGRFYGNGFQVGRIELGSLSVRDRDTGLIGLFIGVERYLVWAFLETQIHLVPKGFVQFGNE